MGSIISTITLSVLGNFATDLIRWTADECVEPLDEAIRSTANSFPELEGVEKTLQEWLRSPSVGEVIGAYVRGESARDDLPIPALVSELVSKTGFYVAQHSHATAEKILSTFLAKVRAAYLISPTGTLHIANRQDAGFATIEQRMQQLEATVQSAGGLKPALQAHFDEAVARMESGDFRAAKALFESLLAAMEQAPAREPAIERRCHASLGQILASFGENDRAVRHYRKAVQLDSDPVRAAVNAAAADLTEGQPATALQRLENIASADSSPAVFEYFAAKVGALLRLNRHEEGLNIARGINIPGKEANRLELIGMSYRQAGSLQEAETTYRKALALANSRPELQYSLAEVLFSPVIEYRNEHPGTPLSSDLRAKLNEAAELLTAASAGFQRQGRLRAGNEIDSALAVVRLLQERFQEAISLLEPIVKTAEANANDWRTLGFAYTFTNQGEKATLAFKSAITCTADSTTEFILAHSLIASGTPDQALVIASTNATEPITVDNLKWHITKAKALVAMRQFSKAAAIIAAVPQAFSADADLLLTLAELNETVGNDVKAGEAYEEALKNATGGDEIRVRYTFGGFAASHKKFARAVELWRPLIDRNKPNMLLDNYARALYNSRNLTELTSIAADIKKADTKTSAAFAEVAAAAYQRLDDLQEAVYWLEYVCNKYGNKPEFIVQLANITLRLGKREEAIELLDATKATLTDANDIIGYAQAYSLLGRHRDALELGHRAVNLVEDPAIHMASVGVFLAAPATVERLPEEIATHQDVLANFKRRFPKSTQLQSFTIDPERPLDAIQDNLEKHAKQAQGVVAAYKENRMPLQMFANLLGRDLYDTWYAVISTFDLALRSGAGTEEESADGQRLLETATGFIVEPTTLFTFSYLGLCETLTRIGDVYVAQRTLDYLHEMEAKRGIKESGIIGMVDGRFFMQEVTPEQSKEKNAALNFATAWAEKEAKPMGLIEPLTKADKKWLKVLGDSNVATIVTAKQRSMVLLTDDKTLGDIAQQNYGISSVNSQALLLYLLRRQLLRQSEYDGAVVKLLEAGYTARVDASQLFRVIQQEQFQVTPRLKSVLRVLEPSTVPIGVTCAIAAGLIYRVFLEPIHDEFRVQLVLFILETIAKNRPRIEVQRLVRGFLRQQMRPLLTLQLQKIEQLLDRW